MKGQDDFVAVVNGQSVKVVEESKRIVEKYKIDWLTDQECLVWAPNTGHSIDYAKDVYVALEKADRTVGTRDEIVKALKAMGEKFIRDATGR